MNIIFQAMVGVGRTTAACTWQLFEAVLWNKPGEGSR